MPVRQPPDIEAVPQRNAFPCRYEKRIHIATLRTKIKDLGAAKFGTRPAPTERTENDGSKQHKKFFTVQMDGVPPKKSWHSPLCEIQVSKGLLHLQLAPTGSRRSLKKFPPAVPPQRTHYPLANTPERRVTSPQLLRGALSSP
jgi:hypothetical protein